MNENTKFRHSGRAARINLSGREKETDPPSEGTLEFAVKQGSGEPLVLKCFIATRVAELFYIGTFRVGENLVAEFKLAGNWTEFVKLEDKVKQIRWLANAEYLVPTNSNYYEISGEIVELREHPSMPDSHFAVLDCGLYVSTRLVKNAGLKIGDYIRMEGRLDANIIGKAK